MLCATLLMLITEPALAAVGRMAGTFSITPAGTAAYQIPIAVAAGTNGIRPSIALVYDSNSPNGIAGTGWSISGLSAITRCRSTIATNGSVAGIRYANGADGDRYCLDGQPLILVSGTYGGHLSTYRTEIHDYEKIISRSLGSPNGAPNWSGPWGFEIHTRDGAVRWYGLTEDSRIEAPGLSIARTWLLDSVVDRDGNFMRISYVENSITGEHVPDKIQWSSTGWDFAAAGGIPAANGRYTLEFSYELRPDARSGYLWGSIWTRSKRLTKITYKLDDSAVHTYSLQYRALANNSRPFSQLESIKQCGPTGDCLGLTTFDWQDGVNGWIPPTAGPSSVGHSDAVFGDFDGDGQRDIFVPQGGTWHILYANDGVFSNLDTGETVNLPAYPLDYNGDGKTDLLTKGSGGVWHVLQSTGDTANPAQTFTDLNTTLPTSTVNSPAPMDVNGDGRSDIVYSDGTAVFLSKNIAAIAGTGQQFIFPGTQTSIGPFGGSNGEYSSTYYDANSNQSADFDGDGRNDLIIATKRRIDIGPPANVHQTYSYKNIYLSTGDDFDSTPIALLSNFNSNSSTCTCAIIMHVLDINGDGLSDITYVDGGRWYTQISEGDRLADRIDTAIPYTSGSHNQIVDYDGDGRSDMLRSDGSNWRVHFSDGTSFANTSDRFQDIVLSNPFQIQRLAILDMTGDGLPDLLEARTDGQWHIGKHALAPLNGIIGPNLIIQFTDGLGNWHKPFYAPLTTTISHVTDAATSIPATYRASSARPIVVLVSTNDGVTNYGAHFTRYSYWNGLQNIEGRGFLGFQKIRTNNSRKGIVTDTIYRQDFPYTGRPDFITVYQPNGIDAISEYDPEWEACTANCGVAGANFVRMAGDKMTEYEVDETGIYNMQEIRTTERTLTYDDAHGRVNSEVIDRKAPQQNNRVYTTTVTTDFQNFASRHCLGFPARIDITKAYPGESPVTRSVQHGYDLNLNCRRLTTRVGPAADFSKQLKTSFEYDIAGRITSITRNDGNQSLPDRKIVIGWNSFGDYRPVSETNRIDGQTDLIIKQTWNDKLGLIASHTDPRGQVTSWNYDDFGRQTKETRPGPSITNIQYQDCMSTSNACFVNTARFKIRATRSDDFWSESLRDTYGRVVGEASAVISDAGNSESRKKTVYNSAGEILYAYAPDLDANPRFRTRFKYDLLGRVREIDQPINMVITQGAKTIWAYEGLNVTVTDANLNKTTYSSDVEGRLLTVQAPENSGAIYAYWPHGELKTITETGASTPLKSMTYDKRGFPDTLVDANTGSWNTDHNVFGEVTRQADDQSQIFTWKYDQLGRLIERIDPETPVGKKISWVYHQSGNGLGLLDKVSAPKVNGTIFSEAYNYDLQGRINRTLTTIGGAGSSSTDYEYNADSQLVSMTYPATPGFGRAKFNFTYSYGFLRTINRDISGSLQPVYQVKAVDALGRETLSSFSYSSTGFIDSQYIRDEANNRLTRIKTGSAPLGTEIQNYAYQWDAVGNLLERKDKNQSGAVGSLVENFYYDALNRLGQITLNGVKTLEISYAPNGNILSKSDIGTNYTYEQNNTMPHAVTSITGGPQALSYHYDGNGNLDCRGATTTTCIGGDSVSWYSFNKPKKINKGNDYSTFIYGPDRRRIKQTNKIGGIARNIYYIGPHFERETEGGTTRFTSSVFANGRVVYQLRSENTAGNGYSHMGSTLPPSSEAHFVHRDHLGSIDAMTVDWSSGSDMDYSFDAFGKRRNVSGWTADETDTLLEINHMTARGYTGHEHLDGVKSIHMNGRLQDPINGRMMSADPVLGSPDNPQTLNAYSYVQNNPLSLVDPSGFSGAQGGDCAGCHGSNTKVGLGGNANVYVLSHPDIGSSGPIQSGNSTTVDSFTRTSTETWEVGGRTLQYDNNGVLISASDPVFRTTIDFSWVSQGWGIGQTPAAGNWGSEQLAISPSPSSGSKESEAGKLTGVGSLEVGTNLFFGVAGVSGSTGIAFDLQGNSCLVTTICVQVGVGGFVGYGGTGSVGLSEALKEGSTSTIGLFVIGGAGPAGGGGIDVNDSSVGIGWGFLGEGIGGAGGIQFCSTTLSRCE